MNTSILQSYLDEQHIKTNNEENVANLHKAVTAVKKVLNQKKTNLIPYILVAFDPRIRGTDPLVIQVEEIITKKWSTFKNSVTATNDRSTTYVRAVILEALSQLSKDNETVSTLIWLTARDVIRYFELDSEESVIKSFLQELADRAEGKWQASWGINQGFQVNEFESAKISIPPLQAAQVDEEALKDGLLNAMVYTGWSYNLDEKGENPRPQTHNNYEWPKYAAESSAEGISTVVNDALSQQAKSLSSISTSLQSGLDGYLAQIATFLEGLNHSFANSISANNKRSELIWWKQSLYSRLLRTSYRNLDPLNSAVCMAFDLAGQVDAVYPESVDYLLRETLNDVHGQDVEEERLLADWLSESRSIKSDLQTLLNNYVTETGERKPLLNAWANLLISEGDESFFRETGIDKTARLTLSNLVVWLFHGLQAQKLAAVK